MKRLKLGLLTLVGISLINGCGNSSNSSSNGAIKTYNAYVIPNNPRACYSAQGTIVINGTYVSGTVKLTNTNTIYVVSGTYIEETGGIEGGFATNGQSIAEFSGIVHGSTGSGTYSDDYGCRGSWKVSQK